MLSIPAIDHLSDEQLERTVVDWIMHSGPIEGTEEEINQAFHMMSPRTIFFKTLPSNAEVLDLGAGEGSMSVYRKWPSFKRSDLKLHAVSLDVGKHFDEYESYEIKNFETDPTVYEGKTFDAIVCCHFIEHMSRLGPTFDFFERKTRKGSRIYVEWPHPVSKRMPKKNLVLDQDVDISTLNFFDDGTHVETWDIDRVIDTFKLHGFEIETAGRVYLPWVGEQLKNIGRAYRNGVSTTLGTWVAFGWAQYVIAARQEY